MLEDLPSEAEVAQSLLGQLTADLPYQVARYQILLAFDADFGGSGVMLPGGEASYRAYVEARASFVAGNFLAVIVLSQSLIENLLGGHLILDDVTREVRGLPDRDAKPLKERPQLKELLDHALEAGVLEVKDAENVQRLMAIRNPLTHFRGINDPQNLTRKAMTSGVHPEQIMFEDARFAMATIVAIVGRAQFAIGRT